MPLNASKIYYGCIGYPKLSLLLSILEPGILKVIYDTKDHRVRMEIETLGVDKLRYIYTV